MGTIPVSMDPPEFYRGYQWLTKNKGFHQSEIKQRRLMKWLWFCENSPDPKIKYAAGILNSFGDPENWYIYHGIVRTECFIKVSKRPE